VNGICQDYCCKIEIIWEYRIEIGIGAGILLIVLAFTAHERASLLAHPRPAKVVSFVPSVGNVLFGTMSDIDDLSALISIAESQTQ